MNLHTVEQVAPMLAMSKRTLHELTRTRKIPHRILPHTRRCLFELEWLEAWQNGAELEVIPLDGGGRIVRPKAGE